MSVAYRQQLETEHRNWLSGFAQQHVDSWERLLNGNEDAAHCEAEVRRLLANMGVAVAPNELRNPNGKSPDFRCEKDATQFLVEVTCIDRTAARNATGITEEKGVSGGDGFGIVDAINNKLRHKASQCSCTDVATLLAIGTFHRFVALGTFDKTTLSAVLSGKPLTQVYFTGANDLVEHNVVNLEGRSLLQRVPREENQIKWNYSSVSGIIFCGFGLSPHLGVLHPKPARPFDPKLLPEFEFATVDIDTTPGQLYVKWQE